VPSTGNSKQAKNFSVILH